MPDFAKIEKHIPKRTRCVAASYPESPDITFDRYRIAALIIERTAVDQRNQMAEEEGSQEVVTRVGSVGNMSLAQASVMAVRTAQASSRRRMQFEVLEEREDEDGYTIVVSFSPAQNFDGTPGQEQFNFSRTGSFEGRQVLSQPKRSKRFRIKRKTVVLGFILVGALIGLGVMFVLLFQSQGCNIRPCN